LSRVSQVFIINLQFCSVFRNCFATFNIFFETFLQQVASIDSKLIYLPLVEVANKV